MELSLPSALRSNYAIMARIDRLPRSRHLMKIVARIAAGGWFLPHFGNSVWVGLRRRRWHSDRSGEDT